MDSLFDKFNDDEEQLKFGSDMRKYELYVIIPYIVPILFWLPFAIDKNCLNSFVDCLCCPSAILEGIETAARLI